MLFAGRRPEFELPDEDGFGHRHSFFFRAGAATK
jgi:hypothetical protein